MHALLPDLRSFEIAVALREIPANSDVLELGAASGWQAARLMEAGHRVVAIDVVPPGPGAEFDAVQVYDGVHIPLADNSVDVVFSSNCLEHVQHLPELLGEMARVLRPGGLGLHLLPSPGWRLWTLLSRFVWLAQMTLRLRPPPGSDGEDSALKVRGGGARSGSIVTLVRRALVEPPHGEFSSAYAELREYSVHSWSQRFNAYGWTVLRNYPTGIFYTGYGVAPGISLKARMRISRVLGSACTVFLLKTHN